MILPFHRYQHGVQVSGRTRGLLYRQYDYDGYGQLRIKALTEQGGPSINRKNIVNMIYPCYRSLHMNQNPHIHAKISH